MLNWSVDFLYYVFVVYILNMGSKIGVWKASKESGNPRNQRFHVEGWGAVPRHAM